MPAPPRRSTPRRSSTRPSTDRKSTRLNSSHARISYAVFCLKKNDKGQIVGFTGACAATSHAVVWDHDSVSTLHDNKTGAEAFGNNNRAQIVGCVGAPD